MLGAVAFGFRLSARESHPGPSNFFTFSNRYSMRSSTRSLPKSWSSTLSLPKSSLPPRAISLDRYITKCSDELYAWQKSRHGEKFILQDGPPYANGDLHIGHALNKILKDITCRFQLSKGKVVDYVPGWDCHGLPIELKALEKQKELGILGERPGPVAVRDAARQLALKTVEDQKRSFRKWGIMADWDNAWKTMDKNFEIQQLNVFKNLVKRGLIYRRFKPVYWSFSSRTALAEAELEYNETHTSTAVFAKYRLRLSNTLNLKLGSAVSKLYAVIWTTTPWTLPANSAIGIGSSIDYVVVESQKHGLLLVGESRVTELQNFCMEKFEHKFAIRGSELLDASYEDPIFSEKVHLRPLLHANFVNTDSGTGLVHLAPGHGMDDYELCQKNGIPAFAPLDDEGRFTALALRSDPDVLLGKEVLASGNEAVIDILTRHNMLLGQQKYEHKYPYDWRSKQPVIVRATEQWFADVREIREASMQSLDSVTFIPEGSKERLKSFVKNRSEWCISRQRAWGVPIPALYNKQTGEAILTEQSISHIISVIKDRGIDAWWTDGDLELAWIPPWLKNDVDDSGQILYLRGKDTMDVWFDSGTSWTQTKNEDSQGKNHVADIYFEGTDQHRGWFQSSLLTYIAQQGSSKVAGSLPKAPFSNLITHGFTLDRHGRKMSKSVGNIISPHEIIEGTLLPPIKRGRKEEPLKNAIIQGLQYDSMGPDALRLWTASCDYTRDVIISEPVLKAINSNLAKYRVTFKLLLGLLADYSPLNVPFTRLHTIHQIALIQLSRLETTVLRHYAKFEYNRCIAEINRFVNADLSASYIESIKDPVYAGGKQGLGISDRHMAQSTLLHIFTSLQQMLAPICPILIEEIWDYTPKEIQKWQGYPFHRIWGERGESTAWKNSQLEKDLPNLLLANAAVKCAQETARSEKKMGSSLQSFVLLHVETLNSGIDNCALQTLNRYRDDLESLFVVSQVDVYFESVPTTVSAAEWVYKAEFIMEGTKVFAHVYTPHKAKCTRCWRYVAPVEVNAQAALCSRCDTVVEDLRQERPELFENRHDGEIATAA